MKERTEKTKARMEGKQERAWVKMVSVDVEKFTGKDGWTWEPGHDVIMEKNQQTYAEIWLPDALPAAYLVGVIGLVL